MSDVSIVRAFRIFSMVANLQSHNFVRVGCEVGNKETGGYGEWNG